MSGNARKPRSKWDNREENQISARTSEKKALQERESYPRHPGHDPKSSDFEADYASKPNDFPEWSNREQSPRRSGQRDAKRDSYDISRSRRSGDVARSYPVSPPNSGPGRNRSRSPEGAWDLHRRRSRSRSTGRGRGRSRSPGRGRNRSRSLSGGRGTEGVYGGSRSRSPVDDYNRRELHRFSERRSGFRAPQTEVCRNFAGGNCRRGSQCRYLHPDNLNPRDGGRSERDQPERWGTRGERGGSRYDLGREEPMRSYNSNVCNDFLKGRCRRGSSCRYSHHDASGDNSHERQPHVAPCKFFMMGSCSRNNCRFSHDAPIHDNREVQPYNDRWDHGEKTVAWNGPTWDEAEKMGHSSDVKDTGWNGPAWDDAAVGSDVGKTVGWGDIGIEKVNATNRIIAERDNDDEPNYEFDNQRKNKDPPPDSNDVDMDVTGLEAPKEINKVEPHYQTPHEFSINSEASVFQQPTSAVTRSLFPENSRPYNKMEGNILMVSGYESVNGGDIYANAERITPKPGHNFNHNSGTFGLPPQQFVGISQDQLVNSANLSDGHSIDLSGRVQEHISPFKEQNSIDTPDGLPVINQSVPQMMDNKPMQISNLPASLSEKFVNEQLPQLYAVLNPPKPAEPIPSVRDSGSLFPPLSSLNAQPDPTSIYQKRDGGGIEPKKFDNNDQFPGFSSNSITEIGDSMNNNLMSSQLSQQETVRKPVLEEPNKPIVEKANLGPENNGAGNVEAAAKVGDGANVKDEKAMRLFKNSLVEFVKDILKPKWKEGQMSRDVHKAIVKKVVDKVTSATQGVNIPTTQAKLDHYLESSKPKLTKLVEAYIERYAKPS